MAEPSGRARVIGSTVVVTLCVWLTFCSAEHAVTQITSTSVFVVTAVALLVGMLSASRTMIQRGPLATATMVFISCVPWLLSTVMWPVFDPLEWLDRLDLEDARRVGWLVVLEYREQGAMLTAGLLCAEALTLTRLSNRAPPRRGWGLAAVLTVPMQVAWWHVFGVEAGHERPLLSWVVIPLFAAVIVPLSISRGARRTAEVIATLTIASWAAMAVTIGQLWEGELSGIRCGPASRADLAPWLFRDDYPSRWVELAPWEALLALTIAAILLRPTRALLSIACVATVVLFIDGSELVYQRHQLPNESAQAYFCASATVPGRATPEIARQIFEQRNVECVWVYGTDQLNVDECSFNPIDHIRALDSVERIRWPNRN